MTAGVPAQAIVGASHEDPALASHSVMVLNRAGSAAGFCSAIVLMSDVVLTAAHCVPPGAALKVFMRDPGGAPTMLDVAWAERHPDYRPDAIKSRERSVDLAVIKVAKDLPAGFGPAAIGPAADGAVPGTPFRLGGYGLAQEGVAKTSGRFRIGRVAMRAPLSQLLLWTEDGDRHGTGACTGDSGGPVFSADSDRVVALILWSAGEGRAHCGTLTQALWLAPQMPWVNAVLARRGAIP